MWTRSFLETRALSSDGAGKPWTYKEVYQTYSEILKENLTVSQDEFTWLQCQPHDSGSNWGSMCDKLAKRYGYNYTRPIRSGRYKFVPPEGQADG